MCVASVVVVDRSVSNQMTIFTRTLVTYAMMDPNNYRMLAVSGTMYRMYANVIRSLLTEWCVATGQIPDTQYGIYPGRNTLQPRFILWHEQLNPMGRLGCTLLSLILNKPMTPFQGMHYGNTLGVLACLRLCLLSVIQDMYYRDEYVLKDGDKTARVPDSWSKTRLPPVPPAFFALH